MQYMQYLVISFMFMGPCILVYTDHINTNEMQIFLLFIWCQNSTCFRRPLCPSSGALSTVAAATGVFHEQGWNNSVQFSQSVRTVLFHGQDGIAVLVVCVMSCGIIHYLHCVDVGHQCHYALSCIADCRYSDIC